MLENRRHFRLRQFLDVTWKVPDQDVSGEGTVVNISASGLFLQTDKVFKPTDNCVLLIDSGEDFLPFAPLKGKLMWFRRISSPQERYQCGLQFLANNSDIDLKKWLEVKVTQLSEAGNANILGNMAF